MLVMCTHFARSVALRTCSGNTLAQPEVPDKHAFATSGAARGYVGMRGAGHTRPDDHLKVVDSVFRIRGIAALSALSHSSVASGAW